MRVGVFYPGPWAAGGNERHVLAMASVISSASFVDVLTFSPCRWDDLGRRLNLDLSAIRFKVIPEEAADGLISWTKAYDLWIGGSAWHIVPSRSRSSVLLVVYPPPFRSSGAHRLRSTLALALKSMITGPKLESMASRWTPGLWKRLRLFSAGFPRRALETYRVILANSEFTRGLIRGRWGRESVVLYPPIDTQSFRPRAKRRIILSVGRFSSGGNNKKHLVMIESFRRLVNRGLRGWELHLAGSTHDTPRDRAYFESITHAAAGLPIVVHANCKHDELRKLYGHSAIYWHSAGYGEDDRHNPLAVEHFGIATVEAMAAGCIPIVCGKGGQPEIVEHGVNGFLWTSTEELETYSLQAVHSWRASDGLRTEAVKRSRAFGMEQFAIRLGEIVNRVKN